MNYEKPQIVDAGMSEGVYLASGDCDCFTFQNEKESISGDRYWLYFEIIHNEARTHIEEEDWNNLYVEITFSSTIPSTVKLDNNINGTISGNKIIVEKNSIIPSATGCSYEGIWLSGEGATSLKYTSLVIKHHL